METSSTSTRVRRYARLVLSGALAAAALALPACGGDEAPSSEPTSPAAPGAAVDPGASSGVGGVINKAKATASDAETHNATLDTAATTTP